MKNVDKSSFAGTADEQSANADVQHVNQPIAKPSVVGGAVYPLAFITARGCLFMRHRTSVSIDGTPRYVPNPNSPNNTYSLQTCLIEYRPIYSKKELKQHEKR